MSINVTVTGNPVSINRGKMVTTDVYNSNKEFEKRRLMRLEQVRQQSKDIAEEVRNKVRKEKKKCLGEIERQGKENLKCWQNKKLLELQQQYKEALENIGMGHKQAAEFADETEDIIEQKEVNDKIANHRGKVAVTKMQIEKNEENMKKAIPLQKKKLARDIENTRSALVSNLKKKSITNSDKKCNKRRRASADINITIPSDSDSSEDEQQNFDAHSDLQSMPSIPEEREEDLCSSSCECTKTEEHEPGLSIDNSNTYQQNLEAGLHLDLNTERQQPSAKSAQSYSQMLESHKSNIESFREARTRHNLDSEDTRISDRIKRREMLASQPDYCDIAAPITLVPNIESNTKIRDSIDRRELSKHRLYNFPESGDESQTNLKINSNKYTLNTNEMPNNPTSSCCANNNQPIRDSEYSELYKNTFGRNLTADEIDKLKKFLESIEKGTSSNGSKVLDSQKNKSKSQRSLSKTTNKENISVDVVPTRQPDEIPSKPPVKIKGVKVKDKLSDKVSKSTLSTDTNRVHFYDHPNRFSVNRDAPLSTRVEKIDSSSVEVIPNLISEAEIREKMKQRDNEAQIRGKKALEKEKVQRDYKEMMKKLPVLQKIERISEISKDKPEYHMSEERLQELERKRQNELENIFGSEFPALKPAIVTLPQRKNESSTEQPINAKKLEESTESINVAKWDVDYGSPKMFSAEEVREIVNAFTGQKTEDRRKKLKDLIKSLKMQEEQLLNEIRNLPQDESTKKLINDLSSFIDDGKRKKEERKRRREETESSTESVSSSDRHQRKHKSKSSSPRKKAKVKSKRVLILQNMSTQTTPKPVKEKQVIVNLGKEPSSDFPICEKLHTLCDCSKCTKIETDIKEIPTICKKQHTPCYCKKDKNEETISDELCQILIRINDDDKVPEVVVKSKELEKIVSPPKKKSPEGKTESNIVSREIKKPHKKIVSKAQIRPDFDQKEKSTNGSKAKSWKEQLSKNSISTSSTSYLSPPDYLSMKQPSPGSSFYGSSFKRNVTNETRFTFSQSTISNNSIDPRLANYVKKLLSMSRISIDELAVSSSEVPTPSQSVIEIETNNPLAQLQNVIKYFNIKTADLARELSYSESSQRHNNTSVSTSTSGSRVDEKNQNAQNIPERDISSTSKDSLTNRYADITDSCSKRIASLAAMIEKLREEKVKILQGQPVSNGKCCSPGNSDKELSTAYMDLPHSSDKSKESSKSSSTRSWDDNELTRKLLEIDMSLADKLKKFPTNAEDTGDGSGSGQTSGERVTDAQFPEDEMDSTDREFYERLKRLREIHTEPTLRRSSPVEKKDEPSAPFVSFLDNIPKLPKFEALPPDPTASTMNLSLSSNNRKHPPPSKGLVVAKKFNEDISLVPHELSTIAEAESLVSTRANTSKVSPRKEVVETVQSSSGTSTDRSVPEISLSTSKVSLRKENTSEATEQVNSSTGSSTERSVPEITPEISVAISKKSCDNQTCSATKNAGTFSKVCTSASCTDSSCKSKKTKKSSSSSEEIETIESMLRSIGMEWAIPTLYKTQEALALTSSSSSSDLSKSKTTKSMSFSEVSLRDFLKKQMLGRVSSSTLRTDASPSSLLEFSNLSGIQGNSSGEKANQRTSTPILQSKSTSKSKNSDKNVIFTEESEISSVRGSGKSSDKFHSLSDDNSASRNK